MASGQAFRRRPKRRPDRLDVETLSTHRATVFRVDLPREARVRIGVPQEMSVSDVVAALREMASYLRGVERENSLAVTGHLVEAAPPPNLTTARRIDNA